VRLLSVHDSIRKCHFVMCGGWKTLSWTVIKLYFSTFPQSQWSQHGEWIKGCPY